VRPSLDHRLIIKAILWLTRTGAPCRDLPERYASRKTLYIRFRHWSLQGIGQQVFDVLLEDQQRGDLDIICFCLMAINVNHNAC